MGKVVVITGAGSGLGRAMARRLAKDGHRLVLLGRSLGKVEAVADEIGAKYEGGAWALSCDVGEVDSVRAAFAAIGAREPRIDVLINNAAVYEPFMIDEGTDEQVAQALDTNLAGTIHCTRAALGQMVEGSHVINISTRTVAEPAVMLALYQTSKAGLERFTKTLREEVAERGIRVSLLRAAGMMEEGMTMGMTPEVFARFREERAKRKIGYNAVSQFTSVADMLPWLIDLPADVAVTELMLEARAT